MSALFDLSGRTALVTGATQGMGLAIAQALAMSGASVIVSDRDETSCARTATALRDAGHQAIGLAADLGQPDSIDALCSAVGVVDVLGCNAGIQGPAGPIAAATDTDWQQVIDINLRSAVRLTSRLFPGMAERGEGSVVLMSSIAGLRGNRAIGLYGLSKAAIEAMRRIRFGLGRCESDGQ